MLFSVSASLVVHAPTTSTVPNSNALPTAMSERPLLMIPGPVEVSPEVLRALFDPSAGTRTTLRREGSRHLAHADAPGLESRRGSPALPGRRQRHHGDGHRCGEPARSGGRSPAGRHRLLFGAHAAGARAARRRGSRGRQPAPATDLRWRRWRPPSMRPRPKPCSPLTSILPRGCSWTRPGWRGWRAPGACSPSSTACARRGRRPSRCPNGAPTFASRLPRRPWACPPASRSSWPARARWRRAAPAGRPVPCTSTGTPGSRSWRATKTVA